MVLQLELIEGTWNVSVLQRNTKEVIAVSERRVVVNCERLDLQPIIQANCIILTKKLHIWSKEEHSIHPLSNSTPNTHIYRKGIKILVDDRWEFASHAQLQNEDLIIAGNNVLKVVME